MFLGIGTGRMDRLLAHARQGGVTPPVDGRVDGGLTKSPEWFDADSWFCWAYHNIAEFIATMPMKETSLKAIEDLVPELSDFTVDGKISSEIIQFQMKLDNILGEGRGHNSSVTLRSSR